MSENALEQQHKQIYNSYLKALANAANRPFRYRKNFDDLDETLKLDLIKMGHFFDRNPEINIDLYFKAGFELTKNDFLPFQYFFKPAIIKKYCILANERYNTFADSKESLDDFVGGMDFILSFCKEQKIPLKDYFKQKNERGILYPLLHLKKMKISLYHFHVYNVDYMEMLRMYGEEIMELYLEDFKEKFYQTKQAYVNSKTLSGAGKNIQKIIFKK